MKRILALLLALAALLSLSACGKKKDDGRDGESERPAAAVSDEPFEVRISLGNLYEYFEYREYPSLSQDEDGNINALQVAYGLALRPGYTAAMVPGKSDDLQIVFTAEGVVNQGDYQVDFDTRQYRGETYSSRREEVTQTLSFWPQGDRTYTWAFGLYSKSYINYLENFQVISAQGTVHLRRTYGQAGG